MTVIISGIVLLLLAFVALISQRLYSCIPAKELKRLARNNDPLAAALYRPVAYGVSLRLFLWIVSSIALAIGLLLLMSAAPILIDFVLMAAVLIAALVSIPSLRLTVNSARFAAFLAPAINLALSHLHNPLSRLADIISRYREFSPHSGLYEKEDLLGLIEMQKKQADNRIEEHELELADKALRFDSRHASEILRPNKETFVVDADDMVGPVLMDKLHKSGQRSFLVYKDEKDNIIGSLNLRDAIKARQDIRVFDLIHHDITYVHEDFSLRQVLRVLQQTGQNMAVVVNKFEEFIGTITLDDVMDQLIGRHELETVEVYDDRSAVAAYQRPEPAEEEPELEEDGASTSPDTTEVIE